jgi:hypothetical protein
MIHAKSLRVIGQSLEVAKIAVFEIETEGPNYLVKSDSLSKAGEWILRHALSPHEVSDETSRQATGRSVRFSPTDISRLDEQAQRQRKFATVDKQIHGRLSQLLRTLGDHLDRSEAKLFQISWSYDTASIEFQRSDGENDSRSFTSDKLDQLGWHSRFRRSGRPRLEPKRPGSPKPN